MMLPGGGRQAAGRWRAALQRSAWLVFAALVTGGQASQYSLINAGSLCTDYYVPDVPTEADCFGVAMTTVGLSGKTTFSMDGLGFNGCVYNIDADTVMFGASTEIVRLNSLQYICNGVPTTTTTTTVSTSTMSTTTITIFETQGYSLIDFHESCAMYQIQDVGDETECFDSARPYVGLGSVQALRLDGLGFTGCVYYTGSNRVFYGVTAGATGVTSSFYKYICKGIATTTTTTTTTETTTITTSTSTTETTTVTTSTETSTTTTTSTETTSTSTETTTTSTTSTETTSTSTATTSTYTGSSSTTTSTTMTSSTSTITTTTTVSTSTFTTFTTSTSTMTTMTTTWTPPRPGAGFVGDDPLTIYNGVAKQFWLPEQELVQLLSTSEMKLWGSAFNVGSEQWINHLVLRGPDGESVMRVAVRDDIEQVREDEVASDLFTTLNITLDWLGGMPLKAIPSPDSYAYTWGNVVFAFMRVPDFYIGKAQVEMMVIDGSSARIVIMSVAGPGFEGEQAHLAARYAHLDFVLDLKEKATCEGILPEIWGLRPFSNDTLAMLEVPPH